MTNATALTRIVFPILLFASLSSFGQATIDHWETAVYDSATWKYFPGASDPGVTWKNLSFNDAGWSSGKGGFGYGDGDDRTTLSPVMSVFMRKRFTVADIDAVEQALLHVDYDDGFIAYLNGVEIARAVMGALPTPAFNAPSAGFHEALLYQGQQPEGFLLRKTKINGLLVEGVNVLAVEVHNENLASSDLSAAAFFSLGLTTSTHSYGQVPAWFREPVVFTSSTLPLVSINTNFQSIQDNTRIRADMSVIYNGAGNINAITDTPDHYNGKISIETRGESSQMFPKKSYAIETQDAQGVNLNVSLLDMPPENDWILYAPYTDKTLMRDVLTYKLGNNLGHYAPRTRFVELFLNDDYQGVYVLIERIKKDKNRVDIATLKADDLTGDDVTGGYILRVDKIDDNDYPAWTSPGSPRLPGENIVKFQYFDPKGDELAAAQRTYIQTFMGQLESALSSPSFARGNLGYKKYIDVPSCIDFMLVNEIGKNIDAYSFSTYLYKDKDSNGGKVHMGPLWDFNLAYGNVDYSANAQYAPGWIWDERHRMYWFRRMLGDASFSRDVKCRWEELRSTSLTNEYFTAAIDSMATLLNLPQQRNYQRWPILGVYVWPNQFVGANYQAEINFMKQWIIDRLTWMDANMPGDCSLITAVEHSAGSGIHVYPNPSTEFFSISVEGHAGPIRSDITTLLGEKILTIDSPHAAFVWDGKNQYGNAMSSGIYIIRIYSGNTMIGLVKVRKT